MDGLERWARRQCATAPVAADLLLTLAVLALSLATLAGPDEYHRVPVTALAVALTVLGAVPLVARRAHPLVVLAATVAVEALYLLSGPLAGPGSGLGVAVALYTVASRVERRVALRLAGLVVGGVTLLLLAGLALGRPNTGPGLFVTIPVLIGSWSLGDNVRTHRAYLAGLEERARRLEEEREADARRAVQEERARIARELHDVVAHHVSAIAVQAGVAAAIAERQPERAREALTFIQETSRQALAEMRALLTVLRSDEEIGAERTPQPSLAQVAHLVDQSRAAGLSVTLEVEGAARPLPEALDLSAYRIVQEALTNSLKHAAQARARVLVRYADDALEIEVSDSGTGSAAGAPGAPGASSPSGGDGAGRGLIGMRERVALFGGELVAGPAPGQGFRVRARLPLGTEAR